MHYKIVILKLVTFGDPIQNKNWILEILNTINN
jgi:hypothetical protein